MQVYLLHTVNCWIGLESWTASDFVIIVVFRMFYYLHVCRTEDPAASRELLKVLAVDQCFQQMEIFPSKKFSHFEK